jgi:outer membrane protein TolC
MESKIKVRNQRIGIRGWKSEVRGWFQALLTSNFYLIISKLLLTAIFHLLASNTFSQSLEQYQKIAAENNPGLKAAYKNFESAMHRVTQVSSLPDPNLSLGYFISPVETRVGPQQLRFSLTQMFPWFGMLKTQENAATLMAEAKYQEFLDTRNQLYYQVSATYYPLYELQRFICMEEENLRILSSYKDIATVKFQNNKGDMVDVLRVDIMLNDTRTNLSILQQKKKPLATRFNKLLNRENNETITVPDSLSTIYLPSEYRKDSLLASNPLLDELALKIQASKANEELAVKQGLPKLGIGLDYVMVGRRMDITIPENGKNAFMPMVSFSLPIFRKKHKAAQKEFQLMQESLSLQKEDVSNRLSSSYDRAWFEIQEQAALIELYEEQIQASRQSLSLLYEMYSQSGTAFEEVLRMQQQVLKYQKMKATALAEYHITLSEIDYITAKLK